MHLFEINDMKVCLNPADLKEDIYVSLSFGIGFLPGQISHNHKTIVIGTASAKMFFNYVSTYIKKKYSIETTPVVSMTSSSLLFNTSKTNFHKDIQTVLDVLFSIEIEDEEWLLEKKNTLNRFKEHFVDLNFRGRMQMLEFTHANKSFQFEDLTMNLLEVNPEDVHTMRESLVYPKNCFLFIHGNADMKSVQNLKIDKSAARKVIKLYEPVDIYTLQDAKYEVESYHGNYTCGSIKFDRPPTLVNLAYEYVVLMLIGQVQFKGAYLIEVDPLDASLIYSDRLGQYKHEVYSALSEHRVEQAKKEIYQSLYRELVLYPFEFIEKVGRLHFNGINYFEAMSILEQINYDDIKKFIKERDYKIREGHLRYYREG